MGIFDGIKTSPFALNVELDIQHAITIILLGSVYADDWEGHEELLVVRQVMAKSPIFADSDDASDRLTIQRCKAYMASNDNAITQSIALIPEELRATAFAMAVEIVFADGIIDPKEAAFIEKIGKKLYVSDSLAKSIINTFEILYRAPKTVKKGRKA